MKHIARKRFGQHFLTDSGYIDAIIRAIDPREGERVVGVIAEQHGRELRYRARRGVVIATGGFEWNDKLVKAFLRGPLTGPISVPECEGDGLMMAMEVNASLGNMANAWWIMSSLESTAGHRDARPNFLPSQVERTFPGSIMVNKYAKRFVNESLNYNALVQSWPEIMRLAHAEGPGRQQRASRNKARACGSAVFR